MPITPVSVRRTFPRSTDGLPGARTLPGDPGPSAGRGRIPRSQDPGNCGRLPFPSSRSSARSKRGGLVPGRSHSSSFSRPFSIFFPSRSLFAGWDLASRGRRALSAPQVWRRGPGRGDQVRNSGLLRAPRRSVSRSCVDVCVCWGRGGRCWIYFPSLGSAKMPARISQRLGGPVPSQGGWSCGATGLPPKPYLSGDLVLRLYLLSLLGEERWVCLYPGTPGCRGVQGWPC